MLRDRNSIDIFKNSAYTALIQQDSPSTPEAKATITGIFRLRLCTNLSLLPPYAWIDPDNLHSKWVARISSGNKNDNKKRSNRALNPLFIADKAAGGIIAAIQNFKLGVLIRNHKYFTAITALTIAGPQLSFMAFVACSSYRYHRTSITIVWNVFSTT